jgi:hypothetical protein
LRCHFRLIEAGLPLVSSLSVNCGLVDDLLELVMHEPLLLCVLFGFKLGLQQLRDDCRWQHSLGAVSWETRSQRLHSSEPMLQLPSPPSLIFHTGDPAKRTLRVCVYLVHAGPIRQQGVPPQPVILLAYYLEGVPLDGSPLALLLLLVTPFDLHPELAGPAEDCTARSTEPRLSPVGGKALSHVRHLAEPQLGDSEYSLFPPVQLKRV